MIISRQEAYELVKRHLASERIIYHVLSVEAVMRALAEKLGEDVDLWGVTGLIHDLDLDITADNIEKHAYVTVDMLKDKLPEDAKHAIIVHALHVPPKSRFDWGLYCADPVTGLITAGVMTHPSKDIHQFSLESLKKRFKDRRFAAGANREQINSCVQLGLDLDEFLSLSLTAMQNLENVS